MRNSGFSLIEIVISILIISITAIVLVFFTKNSLMMSNMSKGSETAYMIAELKLADLTVNPFPVNGNDTYSVDGKSYTRAWIIADAGNVTRAEITVTWPTMNGNKQIILTGAVN